ncbi:GntR family transcriptional regulator [Streptoalloteichus tenebrarius]|uniref:GntR family transcriptional regulator n=1 Tax=Streptoalloteichus tenebrarius (strain ATCC 17920 / DSM 40477 / JCM 4838 / CBS 697.72 / NBRC 16177 / NCIMB 11028 / NRRL B-12390 / A12253. 1 / ISP 5477) TaxID=1933 RepID=A0ABT1HRU6_STRSD|nr:GntR family transcriptional regulator [Streptoalloteichus tenebrarius]MCP2258243.1 GntR family transcriptional regulator [Streptoalloteichus tenebrarius]
MTKHQKIANELRDAIASGEYPAGALLPAIPELMARYDVARDTVRDAIAALANEGLVLPRRGVGTVVRETASVQLGYSASLAVARTWQEQAGAGQDEVVLAEWETADSEIAERLGVDPGSRVVHRTRHFTQGLGVAQIADQWFPEHIVVAVRERGAGDLADATRRPDRGTSLFRLLADAGHAPVEADETIGTRMPDPMERETMELPPGVPVLVTYRITTDAAGRPVETTTAVGAGDRMSARFRLPLNY